MARSGILHPGIKLYRKTPVKNEFGEYVEDWAFVQNVRGYVHHNNGRQVIQNDEVFDVIKLKLSVRKQYGIVETDRLEINDNMYFIEFIQPDYTRRWDEIRTTRLNE